MNGTITFEDWERGKYYIIVWCVDEYGNARIVAYDPGASQEDPPEEKRYTISSGNIAGYIDPEKDWRNYFYTIGENPYVPYIRLDNHHQPCIVLYMAPKTEIRLRNTTIEGSDGYWCLFILRYKTLFQLGKAEADDVEIRFFMENIQTDMIDITLLGISLYIVIIAVSRRRRE